MNCSNIFSWIITHQTDEHFYPVVPIAEKTTPLRANSMSASSITIIALLPPSSKIVQPNHLWTISDTCHPTTVEPVKETNEILLSSSICYPTSLPGPTSAKNAPFGIRFLVKTFVIIWAVMIVVSGVELDPFHTVQFPHTKDKQKFLESTECGKLNEVITAVIPRGLNCSIKIWFAFSEGRIFP